MAVVREYLCTEDRNVCLRALITGKNPEEWNGIDTEFVKEFNRRL